MLLDVYIAFLDGTTDQDGYPKLVENPTTPTRRQSPFFPSGSEAFRELKRRIEAGMYEGWPIDWGAWGAVVNKQQILDFVADMYAVDMTESRARLTPLKGTLTELLVFVENLDPTIDYALVASET